MKVAPSIAAAPQINLLQTINIIEKCRADLVHFDIQDGNFVPKIGLGTKIIKDLRPLSKIPFDVHLMLNNPEWIIPELSAIGVNKLSVHYEVCKYPRRTLRIIHENKMDAGLAFIPKTPLPPLKHYFPYLSFVLILTAEPEKGDYEFLPSILNKITRGKTQAGMKEVDWVVDGGITKENIKDVAKAGADIVVSGRGVFNDDKICQNIKSLKIEAEWE